MRDLVICETPEDVADAAAQLIFESQTDSIKAHGLFRIALSGGHTPSLLFEQLATEEWLNTMTWEKWEIFWSDERAVSPEDLESNYFLAHETLLQHVPAGEIWRMPGEAADLQAAAHEYARTLKMRFGGFPEFDTILLGMGPDGHTASLFPGSPSLSSEVLVEAVETNQKVPRRLTLTLPVLNRARKILFLVTGAEKAGAVQMIFEENNHDLPAARVLPPDGECLWLLDHAAASLIR